MTKSLTAAAAALLLAPVLIGAQDFDEVEIRTEPVAASIYMLQGRGGNIGVSVGEDGTFIVDDQFAPLTRKITAAIAELTDHPVDFVINTHFHYDHTDGNENFGRAGAIIVAQENSRERMTADQVLASGYRQEAYSEEGLPKITFAESIRFHYNDDVIDIVHLGPAHTDGDAVVWFRTSNVLHAGDLFVRYGLPFIDTTNGGSLEGLIDAIDTIDGMIEDDTRIIPGHGQLSTRSDLRAFGEMLRTIGGRMRAALERNASVEEVIASHPTRGYAERGEDTDEWVRRAYESMR